MSDKLCAITQAICDYHYALDTRQHGGMAMDRAIASIEDTLSMPWVRGKESKDRNDPTLVHGTGTDQPMGILKGEK